MRKNISRMTDHVTSYCGIYPVCIKQTDISHLLIKLHYKFPYSILDNLPVMTSVKEKNISYVRFHGNSLRASEQWKCLYEDQRDVCTIVLICKLQEDLHCL